jgi:predicted Mrr-cat superfamily restriction endonuclease
MLRSKPNKIERINEFLKDNFVAIGWVDTGDLTNTTKEDIRECLTSLGYEGQSLLTNLGLVNAFVRTMEEGDLVLIRQDSLVHIGKVKKYEWKKEYIPMFMAHIRSVQWLTQVPFKELNASIQSLLKNIRTVAQYSGTFEESGLSQYLSVQPIKEVEPEFNINDKKDLIENAIEILKDLANNAKDENVRLEATKELLKHLKNI